VWDECIEVPHATKSVWDESHTSHTVPAPMPASSEWLLCTAHVYHRSIVRVFNLSKLVYYRQEEVIKSS